jgi:hypothetical protein
MLCNIVILGCCAVLTDAHVRVVITLGATTIEAVGMQYTCKYDTALCAACSMQRLWQVAAANVSIRSYTELYCQTCSVHIVYF